MSQTPCPASVSPHYQRLAELPTLPFRQRADITEPSGRERGHVWHWHDVYPELARSGEISDEATALQRRAYPLQPGNFGMFRAEETDRLPCAPAAQG